MIPMKVTGIKTGLKFIAALHSKIVVGSADTSLAAASKALLEGTILHLSVLKDSAYSFPHKYALF